MKKFYDFLQFYIFLFVITYFITYPLKVYKQNEDISILYLFVGILTPIIFFLYVHILNRKKTSFVIEKNLLIVYLLILSILLLYSVNILHYNQLKILPEIFMNYLSYSVLLTIFLIIKDRIHISSFKALQWLILALTSATFLALIHNSFLYRIPIGKEILPKYFIGPIIRAGGGYIDPNFLSINIFALIFLSYTYIDRIILRVGSLALLFLSLFLTFSRGAIIFGTIVLFIYLFNNKKKSVKWFALILILLLIISILIVYYFDLTFLFDRFTNEEGSSSTQDRLFQYRSFLSLVYDNASIKNVIMGFGGQDYFISKFGVALHSFWLSLILDIGFLAPLIILALWFYFYKNAKNNFAKYLLVFCIMQLSFLPNLPDTLYLSFILSLLNDKKNNTNELCSLSDAPVTLPS